MTDLAEEKVVKKQEEEEEEGVIHPLLIDQVINRIFKALDSFDDLYTCHNVCQLWRDLCIPFLAQQSEIIELQGNGFNKETLGYFSLIQQFPRVKSNKFMLAEANLDSPLNKFILSRNGNDIKELTLWYESSADDHFYEDENGLNFDFDGSNEDISEDMMKPDNITSYDLRSLLLNTTPFLEILILKALPEDVIDNKLFPDLATLKLDPTKALLLRKIDFWLGRLPRYSRFSSAFLTDLFSLCPDLESLVIEESHGMNRNEMKIIKALIKTNRLKQLKTLKIRTFEQEQLDLLNNNITNGQLEKFVIGDHASFNPSSMESFIYKQSCSLKWLELSMDFHVGQGDDKNVVALPNMPNLTHLKLTSSDRPRIVIHNNGNVQVVVGECDAAQLRRMQPYFQCGFGILDYARKFPKLSLLQLKGHLDNYMVDEIFPTSAEVMDLKPCTSLVRLQHLPIGIDAGLMERIGKLFPNLSILCTFIPWKTESLLVSVWEFCPKLTELYLTFDVRPSPRSTAGNYNCLTSSSSGSMLDYDDAGDKGLEDQDHGDIEVDDVDDKQSLNSIFSGLPDSTIDGMMDLIEQELQVIDFNALRTSSSICDLKKLHRLILGGPGSQFLSYTFNRGRGHDLFTNIFGYSTLSYLTSEITLVQVDQGLTNISSDCLQFVCSKSGLDEITEFKPVVGFRLVKIGTGYEHLKFMLPSSWYGFGKDEEDEIQWL